MKKIVKALLPTSVVARIQTFRERQVTKKFKNLGAQEIFSEIYEKGLWGKSDNPQQPFYSGIGSHDKGVTEIYLDRVTAFLKSLPKTPSVVDLGCGDFSVGAELRKHCDGYVACDIVPKLVEHNKVRFKDLNVDFRVLDLIADPLPAGDVVFIRQVLQHLSNTQIQQLIPKLSPSYTYVILTEHLPKSETFVANLDKSADIDTRIGYESGIVLTKPPFNLKVADEQVLCEAPVGTSNTVIRTTLYRLK